MTEAMIISKSIKFKATKAQVWDLLTNPVMTKQYMFGCEVISDWEFGSPICWKAKTEDGQEITHVKGEITEIIEGQKVSFTMLDPNIGLADVPENYVHLSYEVTPDETGTIFHLKQDFEGTQNAEKRYQESLSGWDMVIGLMKKVLYKT